MRKRIAALALLALAGSALPGGTALAGGAAAPPDPLRLEAVAEASSLLLARRSSSAAIAR